MLVIKYHRKRHFENNLLFPAYRFSCTENSTRRRHHSFWRFLFLLYIFHHFYYCLLFQALRFAMPAATCVLTYTSPSSSPFLGSDLYHSSYSTNICRPNPNPSNCRWSFRYYCRILVFPVLPSLEYSYIFAAMNFMCESSALLQTDPHYYKISKATSRLSCDARTWGLVWMSNFIGDPYAVHLSFSSVWIAKERNHVCMYYVYSDILKYQAKFSVDMKQFSSKIS
jgi:hypothetical protein